MQNQMNLSFCEARVRMPNFLISNFEMEEEDQTDNFDSVYNSNFSFQRPSPFNTEFTVTKL